jgi:hypothetical protein
MLTSGQTAKRFNHAVHLVRQAVVSEEFKQDGEISRLNSIHRTHLDTIGLIPVLLHPPTKYHIMKSSDPSLMHLVLPFDAEPCFGEPGKPPEQGFYLCFNS